jgi:hypothetical protein
MRNCSVPGSRIFMRWHKMWYRLRCVGLAHRGEFRPDAHELCRMLDVNV